MSSNINETIDSDIMPITRLHFLNSYKLMDEVEYLLLQCC